MSRLRNRMVKAEFWTDPELLRWPLAKRFAYQGLWAIAEDSGCLEDDPFGWKVQLFPSPLDAEVSLDRLAAWRDEWVEAGKLVPYEVAGKRCLFIHNFHKHQSPRNPQKPDLPLPPWVRHEATEVQRGDHTVTRHSFTIIAERLLSQYGDSTVEPASPLSSLVLSSLGVKPIAADEPAAEGAGPEIVEQGALQVAAATPTRKQLAEEFDEWWPTYGRVGDKARAFDLYGWWRTTGTASAEALLSAAVHYRDYCQSADRRMKDAATFLAKPQKGKSPVWPEWAEDEPHGPSDVTATGRLSSVLEAGADVYNLGGNDGRRLEPAADPQADPAAGRGLSAGSLAR